MACDIILDAQIVTVINVHMPDVSGDTNEFTNLNLFVTKHWDKAMIIVGDFNAHIGKLDLTATDKLYIGPNLLHDHCNANGDEVRNMVHIGQFSIAKLPKDFKIDLSVGDSMAHSITTVTVLYRYQYSVPRRSHEL